MAEKYESWSTYQYVRNNPILRIDPDGMSDDNYEIHANGHIDRYETADKTNNYVYIDRSGNKHDIGTYNKNDNGYVQLSNVNYSSGDLSVQITAKPGNESELFVSGNAMASLIGASAISGEEIYVTRGSNSDGSSPGDSQSHIGGNNIDTRYAQNNGSRASLDYEGNLDAFNKIDQTASASMNSGLSKFGWKDIRSSTLTISKTSMIKGKEITSSTNYSVSGTNDLANHFTHQHVQGYNPNLMNRVVPPTPVPLIRPRIK